jgi:uncharacterized protein YgbK (DUF1537 family)
VIAVIADDLTGAAEIAGVGLRYGLRAEVQTELRPDSKADVVVIDTDSRCLSPGQASRQVATILEGLGEMPVDWIYKKVDSVLRGPVTAELEAVLETLGKDRIILVPANPSCGRVIRRGRYFVNGRPLDETDFSHDPEYPAGSSDVLKLLGASRHGETCVLRPDQPVATCGIVVGEAENAGDLLSWAGRVDARTCPAGAAEFFAALLEVKGFQPVRAEVGDESEGRRTALFVCASGSAYSRQAVKEARNCGAPIAEMPAELFTSDDRAQQLLTWWAEDAVRGLERNGRAIMAISQPIGANAEAARALRVHTAAVVGHVVERISIGELYVEGGSTGSAIVRRLKWKRLFPCSELAPGVVRMRIEGQESQYLTIKPGSYPWPERIWRSLLTNGR